MQMMSPRRSKDLWLLRIAKSAGVGLVAVGMLLILTGKLALTDADTAFAFLLSGLALGALTLGFRPLALTLNFAVMAIGAVTLFHEILQKSSAEVLPPPSGSLALLLLGVSAAILSRSRQNDHETKQEILVVQSLVAVALPLALVAALPNMGALPILEVSGLFVLGLGLMAYTLQTEPQRTEHVSYSMPFVSALSVAVSSILMGHAYSSWEKSNVEHTVSREVGAVHDYLVNEIENLRLALNRMGERINAGATPPQWQADALQFLRSKHAIRAIARVDSNGKILQVVPSLETNYLPHFNLMDEGRREVAFRRAILTGRDQFTESLDLQMGRKGFLIIIPVGDSRKTEFLVGSFVLDTFLDQILHRQIQSGFAISVFENDTPIYTGAGRKNDSEKYHDNILTLSIPTTATKWVLKISTPYSFTASHQTYLPALIVILGILFAIALGTSLYLIRLNELKNAVLQKSVLAISNSEEHLRTLIDHASDGIVATDLSGRITNVNQAASKMMGYGLEQVSGQSVWEFATPVSDQKWPDLIERLQSPGAQDISEWQIKKSDGTQLLVEISSKLYADNTFLGFVRDISERKRHESEQAFMTDLNQNLSKTVDYQERLQIMADSIVPKFADVCIVSILEDNELRFKAISAENAEDLQFIKQLGRHLWSEVPPHHSLDKIIRNQLTTLIKDVKTELLDLSGLPVDLRWRLEKLKFRSLVSVPLVSKGHTVGLITLGMSNSQRLYTEAQMPFLKEIADQCAIAVENAKLYVQAQQAVDSRELVLSIVSHELRNPVATIDMAAQVLSTPDRLSPEKYANIIGRIRNSTYLMSRMISDLLDFSKMQAGTFGVDKVLADAHKIVTAGIEPHLKRAKDKNIQWQINIPDQLPRFSCDQSRMTQVLWNLVGNAVKFSPDQGTISVWVEADDAIIRWHVKDEGPGLAAHEAEKIFERFWQAEKTANLGTGLGLSIARGIVEAHGGKIWVDRANQRGCQMNIEIPLAPSDLIQIKDSSLVKLQSDQKQALVGLHILAVDDCADNLAILSYYLERSGAKLTLASSVAEALKNLVQQKPDLILSDIEMPTQDGFDLIRKLKDQDQLLGHIPVVALTAHDAPSVISKIAHAGFAAYLLKPLSYEKLVSELQRIHRDLESRSQVIASRN